MKKVNKLLVSLFLLLVFDSVSGQKTMLLPREVEEWFNISLENAGNKRPMANYDDDALFFSIDSAMVIGYLNGYKPSEGFKTAMLYTENEFSRKEHPVVVEIFRDGRFRARVPMWYPKVVSLNFNGQWLDCYIEPGQTLALAINWTLFRKSEDNKAIQFYGPLANVNRGRNNIPVHKTDDEWLAKQVRRVKPEQFKEQTLQDWEIQKRILDSILTVRKFDEKLKALFHAELNITMLMRMHDYVKERNSKRRTDSSNTVLQTQLPADFYDFIKYINIEGNPIFISKQFSWFINKMEFGPLFKAANLPDHELRMRGMEKVVRLDKMRDSIARNELYLTNGKIYDLIRLHLLTNVFRFELHSLAADTLNNYHKTVKESLCNRFYQQQADLILEETLRKRDKKGTAIPESHAGTLFKKMIAPYAGKVIFIDFWATTCGPCIGGIKQLYATRLKYKNNDEFTFLFVTAEDESPKKAYQSFIKKQELANTLYLNVDDYRYIRELFGINGIPRYIVISKEGRVLNDNFEMHNFKFEIGKYLPQYVIH